MWPDPLDGTRVDEISPEESKRVAFFNSKASPVAIRTPFSDKFRKAAEASVLDFWRCDVIGNPPGKTRHTARAASNPWIRSIINVDNAHPLI